MDTRPHFIHPDQLCIGLYIHLDLGWMKHSFTFSNFEIKDENQLQKVKALNLSQIRHDPNRSKCAPLPLTEKTPARDSAVAVTHEKPATPTIAAPEKKKLKLRANRLLQLNKLIQESKQEFTEDAKIARDATRNFALNPSDSRAKAEALVQDLVKSVITEKDVVLHAVSSNSADPEVYVHSLNVTVLAVMLAKSLDLTEQEVHELGMAALLHDIGKTSEYRTKQVLMDTHCEDGARMAKEAGLSENITIAILQHHECADGSGFQQRLVGDRISPLARVLSIANAYDNLCNPSKQELALSPFEALAQMYNVTSNKYDPRLLQLFIRSLGVYPPGSIVQLSNDGYGIVMTANPTAPLLPFVMIYAPNVPRKTSVIIDLSEEDSLTIKKCFKPRDLPPEVFEYFSPRSRVYYYYLKNEPEELPATQPG